jgi:hypothetical protein
MDNQDQGDTVASPYHEDNTLGGCGCGGTEGGYDGGYEGGNVFTDMMMWNHLGKPEQSNIGSNMFIWYSSVASGLFILSLILLIVAYLVDSPGMQAAFSWITGILLVGLLAQDVWKYFNPPPYNLGATLADSVAPVLDTPSMTAN